MLSKLLPTNLRPDIRTSIQRHASNVRKCDQAHTHRPNPYLTKVHKRQSYMQRRPAATSTARCCDCSGRVWGEGLHQWIVVLIVVERVGGVAYTIWAWANVLLRSATVVYSGLVGPEVTPTRIAVVPKVTCCV